MIRREYFGPGGAEGKSLHHWMFPQAAKHIPQGIRNAGWNLLEIPKMPEGLVGRLGLERIDRVGGLNQWMGLAPRWTKSHAIEAGLAESMDEVVRTGVVVTAVGSGIAGYEAGAKVAEHLFGEEP